MGAVRYRLGFYTDTDSFRRWLDPEGAGSGKKTDNTLFVQLMKNTQMQEKFLSLMGELMYTSWRSDLVLAKIDAWYDAQLPEMPAQFERWGSSLKRWNSRVKEFREYAQTRPQEDAHLHQEGAQLDQRPDAGVLRRHHGRAGPVTGAGPHGIKREMPHGASAKA